MPLDADISWSAGLNATAHEVYFGSSFDDVNDATDPNVPPGRGRQDANSYDPGPLELGQTYYWRIDELSEAGGSEPWRGDVWSFDTPEYFVVDDFEDYNNYSPDTVWDTWIDGYEVVTNGGMAGYDLGASIMLDTMASGEQGLAFTDSRSFEPSTWYHAAFAFDGDTTQVYVNGNWENTLNFSGIHQQRYTPGVYFGASAGGANAFDGRLDDIRIYDYALSSDSVANLANAAGEPAPGPVAWYKLDEAGSGTVADSSGNGYDGYVLFVSPYANPYDDNEIGIKDFAVLAETWLEEYIWP